MDRLFDDYLPTLSGRMAAQMMWQPAIDISETDGEIVVKAELPGVDPKNVDVIVTPSGLTIKGEIKAEQEDKGQNYYRRELHHGAFQRTIPLTAEVKSDGTKAMFENGILEVRVPKAERARPRRVTVEVQQPNGDGQQQTQQKTKTAEGGA
jgi:HSP20 family protein